jgi:hypothetical protein
MASAALFRRLALSLAGAVEQAHMGHPDFRANGRIFATLHPGDQHGMVKLTPDDQQRVVQAHPDVFAPENGAWGRQGCTRVRLDAVDEETLGEALTLAWQESAKARRVRKAAKKGVTSSPRSARPRRRRSGP